MSRVIIESPTLDEAKRLADETANALSDAGWLFFRISATDMGQGRRIVIEIEGKPDAD